MLPPVLHFKRESTFALRGKDDGRGFPRRVPGELPLPKRWAHSLSQSVNHLIRSIIELLPERYHGIYQRNSSGWQQASEGASVCDDGHNRAERQGIVHRNAPNLACHQTR